MPTDTHAETSASRSGWPAIEPSLLNERSRRVGGGSGKCANPLGCRYGRCSGNAVADAVGVAESAETPPGRGGARQAGGGRRWDGKRRFTACFEAGWRRGWDSNPRYACTHNGFRDRPDRPLWHLSGAPLIGGRFCPGNSAVGGPIFAFSARNQGFPALTWGASCVYSALLRRVIQARRALSCFPAFWAWIRPIPLAVVGWMAGSVQPEGFSQVSS